MIYLIVVSILLMIGFYLASYRESNQLNIKTYEFHHKKGTKEVKILFFSDAHFGKWYDQKHLPMILTKIEIANPDILICGGDFIDHYVRDKKRLDIEEIVSLLQQIKVPRKFAVMGNHDHHVYVEIMERSGFQLLKNEQVIVDEMNIIGLEDFLCGKPSLDGIKLNNDKTNIAIIHEPDAVDELNKEYIDLFLSGHTHGGQVGIPIIKNMVLPDAGKHYLKGKYTLSYQSSIIVSSGIGRTGLPLRLGNPPELVLLHFKP